MFYVVHFCTAKGVVPALRYQKTRAERKIKMEFKLEDLIDLESARIANAEIEIEEELETKLQSCGDLPGQVVIFTNDEDDYPY